MREAIGMYLGEPGMPALRKQLAELLDNAIDEARAGRANRVLLAVDTSGFFAVGDNGFAIGGFYGLIRRTARNGKHCRGSQNGSDQ